MASGIHCGLKRKRKDLALFYSEVPCATAGIFTKNTVKAAPVTVSQESLDAGTHTRAVIVNSGNANCMTGSRGIKDARRTISLLARKLKVRAEEVLVSSTGIIGQEMNMKPLEGGIKQLVEKLSPRGLVSAADAIMTTDRFQKVSSRTFDLDGVKVRITGVAKGAGMVKPDMATILSCIMTDASISKGFVKKALSESAEGSFNAITVDGDMSTNDTVLLLANGCAGNRSIQRKGKDYGIFLENLKAVSSDLAKMIVRDGEGASKFIEVRVKGARDRSAARAVAGAIAGSLLVKCAVLGGDPNWGRVASSAGASGVVFDPGKIRIKLDGVTFFDRKICRVCPGKRTSRVFKGRQAGIEVDLRCGNSQAVVYSCDISKKYINLNAHYTT